MTEDEGEWGQIQSWSKLTFSHRNLHILEQSYETHFVSVSIKNIFK